MKHVFGYLILVFGLSLNALSTNVYAVWPAADSDGNGLPTLAPMLEKINPAIVNIATYTTRENDNPLLNDPAFRRFFNIPSQPDRRERSAGSGVIIDAAKGTVVTNFHVIKGADEIHVSLTDGRNFKAELIGSDPDVDIAVLKIEADNLKQVTRADSGKMRVGDFVVAIGNPFGLGQTVTTGIISALGRTGLGLEGYEDFIQTDASINPGNSGGALVNLHGELIGINTAILAPSGGNVGIGFAIPTNLANVSIEQILNHGEVRRGQIGVGIQDVTPELQKAFDLKNGQLGVLVTNVGKDSEADKAGLLPGDVIINVDGKDTQSASQLRNLIGIRRIGDIVKIRLIREGKEKSFKVKVGDPNKLEFKGALHKLFEGVTLEPNKDGAGVTITQLTRESKLAQAGLSPGDIIIGANRMQISNMQELQTALGRSEDQVLLLVQRGLGTFYMVIQ
jgi:serine protease Do/serine protease DegQ